MPSFEFLNKQNFSSVPHTLFEILADNMSVISPTANSRDEDYGYWYTDMSKALENSERKIILIKDGNIIIGYFQYCTDLSTFSMEEIQLKPQYHGQGVFEKLYGFLLLKFGSIPEYVKAYTNKNNLKSIGILEHMGLKNLGKSKNGNGYNFAGKFSDLTDWYYKREKF